MRRVWPGVVAWPLRRGSPWSVSPYRLALRAAARPRLGQRKRARILLQEPFDLAVAEHHDQVPAGVVRIKNVLVQNHVPNPSPYFRIDAQVHDMSQWMFDRHFTPPQPRSPLTSPPAKRRSGGSSR